MEDFGDENENSFMVVLLGVIFDTEKRQILIVKRNDDEYIKKLKWAFPGGRANPDESLEESLIRKIKEKTGQNVEILGSIFARIPPEKKDLLLVYYLCEVVGGQERTGDGVQEIKWVKPDELRKYFSTSFEPVLEEYINNLR
ncbi:MAG TPA: NUDIX domain-containing protein [Candidatus Omnitrophota bacterium]|nr:NUDIX domain-containing protein [Candidatus Omnitrophota bacterium]